MSPPVPKPAEGSASTSRASGLQKIGKYLIIRKAGRGGFGDVYEGWDPYLGRNVAIKVLKPRDDEDRRRFEREARVIAQLGPQLPVVAQIYDFFSDPKRDLHFLVEEFLSGVDLKTKLEEGDKLPAELRLAYLDRIAYGLLEVHKLGVVHRDLKPGNVRVLHNHEIKLLDFGLAKVVGEQTLAERHAGVGTPSYAAPEQSLDIGDGSVEVDARADVFSFGVIAYELLTVRRPFEAQTWPEYFELLQNASPPAIGTYWADCPRDLESVLMRSISRDPRRRPSLDEVRGVLRSSIRAARSLAMPPVAARRPSAPRPDFTPATVRGQRGSEEHDQVPNHSLDAARLATAADQVDGTFAPSLATGSARSSLSARVATVPWLVPTLLAGVVLGVAFGIAGRSLFSDASGPADAISTDAVVTEAAGAKEGEGPTEEIAAQISAPDGTVLERDAPAVADSVLAESDLPRFELAARVLGSERNPRIELRGAPDAVGDIAFCQVIRTPPWRLGEFEQPRKRRDDCRQGGAVVYEDVDIEPGTGYAYVIQTHGADGRPLAASEAVAVRAGG